MPGLSKQRKPGNAGLMTHSGANKTPQICGPFKFYQKLVENSKTN